MTAGGTWPEPLRPGDLVGVVAPSSTAEPERLTRGIAVIESWGLRVRVAPHLGAGQPVAHLDAPDGDRAADFTDTWADPEVRAIWCSRGGFGAQRMVDLIDLERIREAGRKHFVGFSDISALHQRIGRELEQVTIHGPILAGVDQLELPEVADRLRQLLMGPPPAGLELACGDAVGLGSAAGVLRGGNLSTIAASVGLEPPPSGPTIALLEALEPRPDRIDRSLTQLVRSGWFAEVVGIVLGDFTEPTDADQMRHVVVDRLSELGVPIFEHASIGHIPRNLAVPLGAQVQLSVTGTAGTLTLS